jgi:hypothetical protein
MCLVELQVFFLNTLHPQLVKSENEESFRGLTVKIFIIIEETK